MSGRARESEPAGGAPVRRLDELRRRLRQTGGRGRKLRGLLELLRPYRGRSLLMLGSLLLATGAALAPPPLAALAIDHGIIPGDLQALTWIVIAFLLTALIYWGATYAQTYLTGWVGERMLADLRTQLFGHLQKLSLGYYERTRAGVIISRLTNDIEALDQLVTEGVASLVKNTLTLIGTAALLFVLDWRLALATLSVIPAMSVATFFFRKYSARAYTNVRERLGLVTATLAEDIAGMRVVQSAGCFPCESGMVTNRNVAARRPR